MSKTYAFMHIKKLKSAGSLAMSGNHNMRLKSVQNADPEKADLNETLVATGTKENGERMSYNDEFKKRISELEYYQNRKPRKDCVMGLEVLMTFTRDENVNIDKWKIQSMKWLHDKFDVAPDHKTNIMNAEFHADESGNVHIHAFVVPIDECGHLNASRFTKRNILAGLQTTYAEYVEDLGISRGVEGSSAHHKTIREMYAKLNEAVEIPPVKLGETAEEYRERVSDELEARFAVKYREAEEHENNRRRSVDQYVHDQQELARNCKKEAEEARMDKDEARKKAEEALEELSSYEEQKEALLSEMYKIQLERQNLEEREAREKRYRLMSKGLEILGEKDPERAQEFMDSCAEVERIGTEWELEQNEQEEGVNLIPY